MKCSTAGVTASGGFICILTVACNEVALLKCSCDPEGLWLLLQHNVSYLKLQKKKNNRGGWSHRHCTTHGTGTSMYPHCRQIFGSSYVFHGVIIHGLKGDNRCLLAPLHSKPSVKLQELAECALSHITKNTRHSLNKKNQVMECTLWTAGGLQISLHTHLWLIHRHFQYLACCLICSLAEQDKGQLPQRLWSTDHTANTTANSFSNTHC